MFIILKAGWNVSLYFKTLVVLFESLMLSSPNPDSARQIFSSPQYTILSHDVLQNYYTITYQMTALCVMMRYYTWSSSRTVFKMFTHATLPQLQITTTWSMQLRATHSWSCWKALCKWLQCSNTDQNRSEKDDTQAYWKECTDCDRRIISKWNSFNSLLHWFNLANFSARLVFQWTTRQLD